MIYDVGQSDHIRWRSESLRGEITVQPSMGTFREFQGRNTAYLGWHHDDKSNGHHLTIELDRAEAEELYRLLGERLGLHGPTQTA